MSHEFPFSEEQMNKIILLYNQGLGTTKIAKEIGNCKHNQVRYALRKYGIEIRASRGRPQKSIEIPIDLLNLINGLLLGDGSLYPIDEINLNSGIVMAQSLDHSEFLEWIKDKLLRANIKTKTYYRNATPPRKPSQGLYTIRTKEFTKLRLLWYPNGKKIVPRTLRLTKDTLIGWYISDGTKFNTNAITLYTNGFTFDDCSFLQGLLLGTFGIESKVKEHYPTNNNTWATNPDKPQPIIYIPKESAKIFFEIMGSCPVKSFQYKWPNQ